MTITFEPGGAGCRPEQAQVSFIPPDVARVLLQSECGGISCWERWLQVGDKRLGYSRACEARTDGLTPQGPPVTVPSR